MHSAALFTHLKEGGYSSQHDDEVTLTIPIVFDMHFCSVIPTKAPTWKSDNGQLRHDRHPEKYLDRTTNKSRGVLRDSSGSKSIRKATEQLPL